MPNLASNLVETASGLGDSVALRVGPTATTYAELDQASRVGVVDGTHGVEHQVSVAEKHPRKS